LDRPAYQARVGHASITTTLNTYGHLMPAAVEGVGTRIDVMLSDQPVDVAPVAAPSNVRA
jgi:hypothetical protein